MEVGVAGYGFVSCLILIKLIGKEILIFLDTDNLKILFGAY